MKAKSNTNARKTASWIGVSPEHTNTFRMMWIASFVIAMGWGLTIPLMTVLVVQAGATYQQLGILQFFAATATILTQVLVGRASDAMGKRKPALVAGILLAVPVLFFYPRAEGLVVFGILLALHGVTYNANRLVMSAWVSSWTDQENMGRTHGAFRIAGSLGWIIAAPFLGVLLDRYGAKLTFALGAALYLAMAIFIVIFIKEKVELKGGSGEAENLKPKEKRANASKEARSFWTFELKMFLVALGVFAFAQGMGQNLNSVFLVDELGVSNSQFGWITSIQAWLEVPLMLGLGIISDRFNPALVLGLSIFVSGARWFLLTVVNNTTWVFGIQSLHAVGITVAEVLAIAFVARLVPSKYLGTFIGWKISVQSAASLLTPMIAGNIAHYFGIRTVFRVSGLLPLLSCLILYLVYRSVRSTTKGSKVGTTVEKG